MPIVGVLKWTRTWWYRVDDKKVKEREKEMGTQALMEQGYFINKNAGLHIFSKMITQLLHRMKFYQ